MRSAGVAVGEVGAPAGARGEPGDDTGIVGSVVVAVPEFVGAVREPADALPPELGVSLLVGDGDEAAGAGVGAGWGSAAGISAGLMHGSLSLPPRGGG